MSNNNQCWIIEDPWTEKKFYFEKKEHAEWFRNCLTTPLMNLGNLPRDGGNFFMTQEEASEAVKREPNIAKYIRQCYGSYEFINNVNRFCLWLVEAEPEDIKRSRFIYDRVQKVREFREASKREGTQKLSEIPYLFAEIRQPKTNYLLVPLTSSEKRKYIPMGWLPPEIIALNSCDVLPNCSLYHFGVITSIVHMAWMRVVGGRLGMSYRYGNTTVWNPFVWPNVTPDQALAISKTAEEILEVRVRFPKSSLASLYDENSMPIELRKAHQKNDEAVMNAYNFPKKLDEEEIAKRMLRLYQAAIERYEREH